jgi:hypothetical protein
MWHTRQRLPAEIGNDVLMSDARFAEVLLHTVAPLNEVVAT